MRYLFILLAVMMFGCGAPLRPTQPPAMNAEYFNVHFADSLMLKVNQYRDSVDLPALTSLRAIENTMIKDTLNTQYHFIVIVQNSDTVKYGFEAMYDPDSDYSSWWSNGTLIWCTCNWSQGVCELVWTNTWNCAPIPGSCGMAVGCKIHGKFTQNWFPN